MTNDEAIIDLSVLAERMDSKNAEIPVFDISLEAVDMAIKALEQEPCGDWYDVSSNEMTLEQARQAVKDLRKKLAECLEQEPCKDVISIPKDALKWRGKNMVAYNVEWLREHWQKEMDIVCGIKPCEDAISRQAVHDAVYRASGLAGAMRAIDNLPSVTPKQRTGYWIRTRKEEVAECVAGTGIHVYVCSKCDEWADFPSEYCPNCGMKMEEKP